MGITETKQLKGTVLKKNNINKDKIRLKNEKQLLKIADFDVKKKKQDLRGRIYYVTSYYFFKDLILI